jgi:transmembrane sensor
MAPNQELRALGRTLAEIQDELLSARERPATSERLAAIHHARALQALRARRVARARPLVLVALAAAVLLALSFRARPLSFVVGPSKAVGQLGVWVAATAAQSSVLAFSDGSRLSLRGGAQARVVSTNKHGARIVLERGSMRSDIVPRADNDWFVVAGPFEIHVTGTSFDTGWEPEQQVLRVTMFEGHVLIRSECLSAPHPLSKGESLALSCADQNVASDARATSAVTALASAAAAPASAFPARSASTRQLSAQSVTGSEPPVASVPATAASAQGPSWRDLARQGKYEAALSAVETTGFDEACRTLPADELLELGTTARLARRSERANAAYLAVRRRFAGSDGAATAAFHLGQIAFDSAGAYAEARKWFGTYLSERPAGGLATEALGREMEAEQRTGDLALARATASSYLSRYPLGAHAQLAKSLLAP